MRDFYAGGTYADAHPSGAKTVLMPDGVLTHQGLIPYDGGTRPLYVRLFPEPFKFAGQASNRFGTMVYDGGWYLDPRIANGTSGCIFDRDGVLRVIEPGPGVTSQGFRYVAFDGTLVTGDETYGPFHGLSEYTYLGDSVWIGQGHELGGVLVWDGATLRRLEGGLCTFIRATRVGELVAIAFSTPVGAVIWQTSMGVLRTLPPVNVHRVPGPIIINDEPKKEPTAMSDVLATLKAVRAKYPQLVRDSAGITIRGRALTQAEIGAILNEVAWLHRAEGVGLERKGGGFTAVQPRTNIPIASDILRFPGNIGRDVLGDGDGLATPVWGDPGPADPASFVAPVDPNAATPPPDRPPADPPTTGVDLSDILRRLEKLEGPRKVAIRTHNGHFYCAEGGGGGEVNATRTAAGPWEEVTLEPR